MKLPTIIWGITGLIVTVAIATQTNIVKNIANRVKNKNPQAEGFAFTGPAFGANESHCYQDGQEVPCGYGYGYDYDCGSGFDPVSQLQDMQLQSWPDHQQPNFTQPLVTPEQTRKNTEHHKKQQHTHKHDEQQVYAQMECPDDPNTLPCGSNCYHNGQLWKTVCSEEQRQELFPSPGSIPSLSNTNDLTNTVPIHANTIPALTYPEDTSSIPPPSQSLTQGEEPTTPYYYNPYRSGGPPQWSIPTGPGPSQPEQNSIHPTTSDQNFQDKLSQYDWSKSSHEQQQRRPTTPQPTTPGGPLSPSPSFSLQRSCHPVNGWVPEPPHKSDVTASNCDCGKTKLKSSGYMRDSCRKFISNMGLTDYTIYATVDVGEQTDQSGNSSNRIEITSGGPGIGEEGGCCGVGMDLNLADGSPHIEIENWSPGAKNRDDPICDGESCRQYG